MGLFHTVLVLALTILASARGAPARSPGETTLVKPPWDHCFGLNRVGQTHLDLYSGYRKKFSSPQGMAALKLSFNDKEGSGDDDELTVYGVNSGNGEIIYNKSLVSLGFYGRKGSGDGEFLDPTGIAARSDGLVVIADTGNDRIVYLENRDNELHYLFSSRGSETGTALSRPAGVALEGDSVYVADTGNDRIVVFDDGGRAVHAVRSETKLVRPFGIAVIASGEFNYYSSRFIVLTDSLEQRLLRLSLAGEVEEVVRYAEVSDRGGGFFWPAVDYYSNVYVTDTETGCLYKFDRSLDFLTSLFCNVDSEYDLDQPRGIAIYRKFGQIFIAERAGASYYWVGTDVEYLKCKARPRNGSFAIEVSFLLTEHSTVEILLECPGEGLSKVLGRKKFTEPGLVRRSFFVEREELESKGGKCRPLLVVKARPTYSSRKFHEVVRETVVRNLLDSK